MVSPPPDVGSRTGVAVPAPTPGGASGTARGAALPSGPAGVDLADIRPLDLAGALQILIAEVRAALIEVLVADLAEPLRTTQTPDAAAAGNATTATNNTLAAHAEVFAAIASQDIDGPQPAARAIVDLVLRSLPETFEPEAWSLLLPRVDLALQSGVQRALDAISAWRDVPPAVVEAAQQSGSLALALSVDEPIYPWPPPEWLSMAPRLGRLWRRRRFLKRRLVDPDYGTTGKWDDLQDLRS